MQYSRLQSIIKLLRINELILLEGNMDYISVKELAEKWKLSERWIQKLCEDGRIDGVQRFGRSWMIPKETEKPGNFLIINVAQKKNC